MRAAPSAGRAAAADAAPGLQLGGRQRAAANCELRAEPVAARGGFAKNSNSWGGGCGAEVGGRRRGRAEREPRRGGGWAGRGRVGSEAGPGAGARAPAPETRRRGRRGPGSGTPGRGAEAPKEAPGPEGWRGGERGAAPAIPPRGRTGRRRLGVAEAQHAHTRRQVMARRRALLLRGSQAADGRDRGRAGGDRPPRRPPGSGRLAAQVRAAQRPGWGDAQLRALFFERRELCGSVPGGYPPMRGA